ncbi:hypothetical protein [Mycobacterium lepromatosis]|uniref:hypothetical protein n=1 Tax=Mycobacterium lepromatosis TaxID=480418 RepID=UPI0005F7B177
MDRLRSGDEIEDVRSPAQLLERLGFAREQLSEPNVLFLDESTNDVDTNMLTKTEDFLTSWAGTLSRITGT